MKILIYEHLTAGGDLKGLSPTLLNEGDVMIKALIRDLREVRNVELQVLRHVALPLLQEDHGDIQWLPVSGDQPLKNLHEAIQHADAVWPIAPETGRVLETICQMVAQQGKRLIASPALWIRRAAGKYAAFKRLTQNGIACVESHRLIGPLASPPLPMPFVIKPEDGAGCEGIYLIEALKDWELLLSNGCLGEEKVGQPLMSGSFLSLSAIFAAGQGVLISCNLQEIDRVNHGFRLKGLEVNARADTDGRFAALVKDVAATFPGLWGYIGIDLVENAEGLFVLEINPRLTTSYVGLHQALGHNPALWLMDLLETGRLPSVPTDTLGRHHLAL